MLDNIKARAFGRYLNYITERQEKMAYRALEQANPQKLSYLRERVRNYLAPLDGSEYERLIYGMALLYDLDPVDTAINAHYWMQTLAREEVRTRLLLPWKREDVFMAAQGIRMSRTFFYMNKLEFIRKKVLNHGENIQKMRDFWRSRDNLSVLYKGPLMIVSNHSGWQNLPYILALLHESLGCSLSRISTIIGTAVANLQAGREVAGMGNLITVIPSTEHGILPEKLKDVEKTIKQEAWKRLKDLAQKPGPAGPNIVIMCPFGTTDKRDSNGEISLKNKRGARAAILSAMRSGYENILPISTYDEGALSGTSWGQKGTVNIELSAIYSCKGLRDKKIKEQSKKILEAIRAGIKKDGKEMAQFAD